MGRRGHIAFRGYNVGWNDVFGCCYGDGLNHPEMSAMRRRLRRVATITKGIGTLLAWRVAAVFRRSNRRQSD